MNSILEEEIERCFGWFETDVGPAVEYLGTVQSIILSNWMAPAD